MNGVSMVLQQDWQRIRTFDATSTGFVIQFQPIVDQYSVMSDSDSGLARSLSVFRELRRIKINVISLPPERRKTHIHSRSFELVKRTAIIELGIQAE